MVFCESVSRRTTRCHLRTDCFLSSQTQTCRVRMSTWSRPFVESRVVIRCQASSGCNCLRLNDILRRILVNSASVDDEPSVFLKHIVIEQIMVGNQQNKIIASNNLGAEGDAGKIKVI